MVIFNKFSTESTFAIQQRAKRSDTGQMIMIILPIALVGIIKVMSPEFGANFVSATGIVSTTIAIGLFIAAYFIGRAIMDIKV